MDEVDFACERQEALEGFVLKSLQVKAANISAGHSGECDKCGNDSPRLMGADFFKTNGAHIFAEDVVNGVCPPCRDRHKLP